MSAPTAESDAGYTPNADNLSEHVIDRHGLVWRIVRDGGMATRAHYAGVVSIGIHTLEREHGPLRTVRAGRVIPPEQGVAR